MKIYAGVLIDKAVRKRALQSTADIALNGQGEEEADSDGDDIPNADLLPELKKKSAAKKASASSRDKAPGLSEDLQTNYDDDDEKVPFLAEITVYHPIN